MKFVERKILHGASQSLREGKLVSSKKVWEEQEGKEGPSSSTSALLLSGFSAMQNRARCHFPSSSLILSMLLYYMTRIELSSPQEDSLKADLECSIFFSFPLPPLLFETDVLSSPRSQFSDAPLRPNWIQRMS